MNNDANVKYVDVEGVRTRYFEKGRGDPLVLLHGGAIGTGSSFEIFAENLDALAESFHVFAPDKIGQGYTDNPATDGDYTIDRMTEHTYQFIQVMGLEQIYLIGQSRGAFNGISLCLDHPNLIRGFVLCNSASMVPAADAIPAYSKRLRANTPFEPGTKEWIRYRSEAMCYSGACLTDDYIDEWYNIYHLPKSAVAREKMKTLGPSQLEPSVDAAKLRVFARIGEGTHDVPTLIHWGKNDPSAPAHPDGLSVFDLLSENAPHVSLHVENRAGHFAFKEKPAPFNKLVKGFFEAID